VQRRVGRTTLGSPDPKRRFFCGKHKKTENEELFTSSVNGDDKTTNSAYIQLSTKVMNKKTGQEASLMTSI
jgi:hypothetical protein